MAKHDQDKTITELDEAFNLITVDPLSQSYYEQTKARERDWKRTDPEGYKKDMEKMCRTMFGDQWEIEYEAMLREEFPEEFAT